VPSIEKDVAVTVVVPHGAAHDVKATEGQKHHPSPGGKVSPGISKDTSLNPPAHPSQASSKGLATDNPYGAPPDQQK
jgi:hypothetical protein